MSRGFVKEDDQEEAPIIPPRAALPGGLTNYVTPTGLKELHEERERIEKSRASLSHDDEREHRRATAVIDGNLNLINERIASARVLEPENQIHTEVRFGAEVIYLMQGNSKKLKFQIVGVDEADVKKQKIAFIAPIAKAVTGKKIGDTVSFKLGEESRTLKIVEINYPD
ncbi:MAG: GreA/GreB family elongation factor [Leeuwenhoekiella sp.]